MEQTTEETDKTKNKRVQLIVGLIVGLVVAFAVQQYFTRKSLLDKQLMEMASELYKSFPMMLDRDTRIDNAVAMPNNVFQYTYSLVNMEKGEVETTALKNFLIPISTNNYKTHPDMKFLRDNNVTLKYYYRDKNGEYLFSFSIAPSQF